MAILAKADISAHMQMYANVSTLACPLNTFFKANLQNDEILYTSCIYCLKDTFIRKKTYFLIESVSCDTRFSKWRRKHAEWQNVRMFFFKCCCVYAHQTRINEQNVKIWKAIFTPDEIDSENDEIGSNETDS